MDRKDILPKIKASSKTDRYSQNLMAWVRKQRECELFVAIATSEGQQYDPSKTQASRLYVGRHRIDEEGFLFGSRLSQILCNGAKTETFAFVPGMKFVVVPDWWAGYISGGKCFIDPEHTLYYDRERWEETDKAGGKHRHCVWCGNFEQYEHTEMKPEKSWRKVMVQEEI